MRKITAKQVPLVTRKLVLLQEGRCPLCKGSIAPGATKKPVLDHCHTEGHIRGALCRNCNGIEGKIKNLVNRGRNGLPPEQYLQNLLAYLAKHATPQYGGILHHTHKTADQKRERRNKLARERRKAKAKRT